MRYRRAFADVTSVHWYLNGRILWKPRWNSEYASECTPGMSMLSSGRMPDIHCSISAGTNGALGWCWILIHCPFEMTQFFLRPLLLHRAQWRRFIIGGREKVTPWKRLGDLYGAWERHGGKLCAIETFRTNKNIRDNAMPCQWILH